MRTITRRDFITAREGVIISFIPRFVLRYGEFPFSGAALLREWNKLIRREVLKGKPTNRFGQMEPMHPNVVAVAKAMLALKNKKKRAKMRPGIVAAARVLERDVRRRY